jgi:hypothetical protein
MKIQECLMNSGKGVAIYLTTAEAEKLVNDLDLAIGLKISPQTVAEKLVVILDNFIEGSKKYGSK